MKKIAIFLLVLLSAYTFAQQTSLQGTLLNEEGEPLMYATAVLLIPADSTMAFYGVSDETGLFEIKNIKTGNYILQTGSMGFQSYFKKITFPLPSGGNDLGTIVMKARINTLSEVEINADRIPILIKKDTMEYVANAFKTKTDGVAEDLLKKLPGIEVDRAGNIKAHGEDVQRVLVDGKEFFSSDPTVATKNLPADAIDKVQVYNKKSDETELSGIEDGSYSKTINLVLKDGKKTAYFGDVTGGYGTDERYQAGGKLFRFTRKNQFAALGMVNNINKSGFSFQDYLNFQGGLQSLMSGGGGSAHIGLDDDSSLPVDFGQSVNGLVSSGAAGLNFTHEAKKDKRFNISYLGNGSNTKLLESSITQNFSETGNFTQNSNDDQDSKNRVHRLNYNWRNRIDSTQNLTMFGGASLNNGTNLSTSFTESLANDVLMNNLYNTNSEESNGWSANTRGTYLKTGKGNWKLFKLNANVSYTQNLSESQWKNVTHFLDVDNTIYDERYQNDESTTLNYSANTSATLKINKLWYLVPAITAGVIDEYLNRINALDQNLNPIAEFSPEFDRKYGYLRSGLSFKRNTQKTQIDFTARIENLNLKNTLNGVMTQDNNFFYFIPSMSWRYEYSTGKRLAFNYSSSVNAPSARQLLPVVNTMNTLQIYSGNSNLKPEYRHNARFNWLMYDQFSQTSIFASISGTYTIDKINFSRTILDNLTQEINLMNVKDDYSANANIDFTTPFKKLGIDLNARFSESWNQGLSYVNDIENINTNFSHTLSLYLNNRKKEKWDLMVGGRVQLSDAKYSLQESLNRSYFNTSAYTDISYTPSDKWYFLFSADVTRYDEQSFGDVVNIPILRAEISRYFLKANRGVLTLSAFDLLDKNTGLERISEMNYLLERTSNVLGRYFMLTFKYRLNKFEKDTGGVKFDVRRRH
ncbi:MAG: outer membrane beta-barrel protein [Bacteroidales bacterium]|nr:outer membrane beta-barrel protein [Bacteroidales bacterium]